MNEQQTNPLLDEAARHGGPRRLFSLDEKRKRVRKLNLELKPKARSKIPKFNPDAPSLRFDVYFDGGVASPLGWSMSRHGYGSFDVEHNGLVFGKRRLHFDSEDYGKVTSNVAEYAALLSGLRWLESVKEKERYWIHVSGDSQLVLKQLTGEYKCKCEHLARWLVEAKRRLKEFGGFTAEWKPRAESVKRFGH